MGTSDSSRRIAAKALTMVRWVENLRAEADLSSWDAANFTLNWTTNDTNARIIHFLAIGGSGVSAQVVDWRMPFSTGHHAVTGIGFRPNVVLHAHANGFSTTIPNSTPSAGFGLGVMDADGDEWALSFFSLDDAGFSDTQRIQQTDANLVTIFNSLTIAKKASWVSMDSDGFTLDFSVSDPSHNSRPS